LFADIKGSIDLMEDLDPEEAREIVDPVLKRMIEAARRYVLEQYGRSAAVVHAERTGIAPIGPGPVSRFYCKPFVKPDAPPPLPSMFFL
jgi:hypothetical protein